MQFILLIVALYQTVLSKTLSIGEQNNANTRTLYIRYNYEQLEYRYCQKDSNFIQLTQDQFNNPNVAQFLNTNGLNSTKLFGIEIGKLLNEKSAIIYQNGLRCKQYTLYSYNSELYDQEMQLLRYQIARIYRQQDTTLSETLKNCPQWDLTKEYDSNNEFVSIRLDGCKYQLERDNEYTITRKLVGDGLHQRLDTTIIFKKPLSTNQNILIEDNLDIYSYVDKDELDKLQNRYQLMTVIDIEKPAEMSAQHLLYSVHKGEQTISYSHPYHLRYQMPSNTHYKTSYIPANPRVYTFSNSVDSNINLFELAMSLQQAHSVEVKAVLTYDVPVGFEAYRGIVLVLTIGLTLGSAMHLTRQIIKNSKSLM